jgi:hypothetical protein
MRVVRGLGTWWLLVAGCAPAVGPDEARPAGRADGAGSPAAEVVAVPPPDGPLELSLDGGPPAPVVEVLPRAPGRDLAPAHVERAGWSADGRTFAHCRPVPGLDCTECRFVARDGTTESLEAGPGCGEAAVDRATLDARLAALALVPPRTRWSAGAGVVLVVETREHEATNAGEPRPVLKLGARPREGGAPAWLLHVDPCQGCGTDQRCAAAAHVDALALSPDGEWLAVLLHQLDGRGDEPTRVELLPAARVAAAGGHP